MRPETSVWPEPGERIRVLPPNHLEALYASEGRTPSGFPIYLLDVWEPKTFVSSLPVEFQSPTNLNPQAGLPSRAWAGYTALEMNVVDLDNIMTLLDIRARIRWVEVIGEHPDAKLRKLLLLFGAWRCSNCGQRGVSSGKVKRPERCPHESVCGDAKLLPQLHWLIGEHFPSWLTDKAKELGVIVSPDIPVIS